MKRLVSALALSLAFSGPAVAAEGEPAAWTHEVERLFAVWDRDDRPGCAVGVVRDGELTHSDGFGMANLEHGVPIAATSVFDIGSVSKQFTAAAIALLALDGKLALDDDVRRYVPELPVYAETVTLRHLLHHRGGLRDYIEPMVDAGAEDADVTTAAEALAAIVRAEGVDFAAGERYEYSNTGYFLLGVVVERVSGQSLPRFAAERIFRPLGMRSTRFQDDHTELVRNRATGYSIPLGSQRVGIDVSDWEQVGDGSVFTTVEDLARWIGNFDSGAVGGAPFLELMALPGLPIDDEDGAATYGLGQVHGSWRGRPAVGHGGSWAGYRAHLFRLPRERLGVAILCNVAQAGDLGAKAKRIAAAVLGEPLDEPVTSMLIRDASIVDGTGAKPRRGDVRVVGDRIAAVGRLEPGPGEVVHDARGWTLAPGFIDTHSHADDDLAEEPQALGAVSQGITTIVGGQDGGSVLPLAEFFARLEDSPSNLNVAMYVGHGSLRERVMGSDFRREARPDEVAAMAGLLEGEMQAGALGLSTGLEYDPGIYSSRAEVIELAKVAARHGGRYISHVRSEDRAFWDAIEEILAIGREAKIPVQISHVKLAMRGLWNQAPRLIARLERARSEGIDVTTDLYPYLYWHSTLTVLFPERDFENPETAQLVLDEIAPADGLLLGRYAPQPEYAGQTVAAIAKLEGRSEAEMLIELIRRAEAMRAAGAEEVESVIGTSMIEPDLEALLAWPHTNLCTDGELDGRHPRGFGSYPRVLGRYVRERGILTLPEAVRRMTSLAADHMGLADRGRIRPGAFADLVLFDPAIVIDEATTAEPQKLSTGIEKVWVNGELVYDRRDATWRLPGRVVRRESRQPTLRTAAGR